MRYVYRCEGWGKVMVGLGKVADDTVGAVSILSLRPVPETN